MKKNKRINLSKYYTNGEFTDLMDIQIKYFQTVLKFDALYIEKIKEVLSRSIATNFPITDYKKKIKLEFLDWYIIPPEYTINECIERGITYSVSLNIRLRITCNKPLNTVIQYLDTVHIPNITEFGSFIINGTERVLVPQFHRAPGLYFSNLLQKNGRKLYSAKVITLTGTWVELTLNRKKFLCIKLNHKKKIPITTFLRTIGYETTKEIFIFLNLYNKVQVNKSHVKKLIGYKLAVRIIIKNLDLIVSYETGAYIYIQTSYIVMDKDIVLNFQIINKILRYGIKELIIYKNKKDVTIIQQTLKKDKTHTVKEAVEFIYKKLTSYNSPNEYIARRTIENYFFTETKYSLGQLGRNKINKKLKLHSYAHHLTKEDFIYIIKYMIFFAKDNLKVDDMDNIYNRCVRNVVEQLCTLLSKAFTRISRIIKENMSIIIHEAFSNGYVINLNNLSNEINSYFSKNPLSQYMDQTNPLSEITHKRRLSALGTGGLSRERAGLEVRDVHYTYSGRICPIETSEGQNIGLIYSLALFARINNMGLLETISHVVQNGIVYNKEYLIAEKDKYIGYANELIDANGKFINNRIVSINNGEITMVSPYTIDYLDISTNQLTSISAAIIPFMEHDDPNRALMGCNMMRQSVPLLNPESPIVGTGLEEKVVSDYRILIHAEEDGIVDSIEYNQITIRYNRTEEDKLISFDSSLTRYKMIKFGKTNQNTTINLKPIVKIGMKVKKGQVLCDGFATQNGELALGINILVAFMPCKGYNFEDALVISERVVKEDLFTSIHIVEYSIEVRETKSGMEELTNKLLKEEVRNNYDKNGIIRVGKEVKPGEILIGKITPKEEQETTPEEKFIRAIFGEKVGKFKDDSLKSGPSLYGVVIGKKIFYRRTIKTMTKTINMKYKKYMFKLRNKLCNKLYTVLHYHTSQGVYNDYQNILVKKGIIFTKKILYQIPNYSNISIFEWTLDYNTNRLVSIIINNYKMKLKEIKDELKRKKIQYLQGDELPVGVIQLAKVYIAKKRKLKVGDKMSGRHGNKGVVAKIVRDEDMPFLADGTKVDLLLNPLGVPSRMNIGQLYETILGWAGHKLKNKFANPIFDGATIEKIHELIYKAGLPRWGTTYLYNGETGERFNKPATVGIIYLLKLAHMVDDKIHARSTGPYSIITQQPLGGKSQFGGQRLGEMEVWALESFGASNILREMLTVKSDYILGRSSTYEAIVKGEPLPVPGIPESFHVILQELNALGFKIILEYD